MAADGTKIVKRYQQNRQERFNFDDLWEQMAPYIAPSRMGINTKTTPGEKQTRNVYDSTGMTAADTFAAFIAAHVMSPGQRWLDYEMKDTLAKTYDDIKEWLEECRDITLKNADRSALYTEGPEALVDWSGFGTGLLIGEEAPQPVNQTVKGFRGFYWKAERTGRFCIQENALGMVDTAFREFDYTARVASDLWGGKGKLPEAIVQAMQTGNPDKLFTFIHAVYPREKSEQTYAAGALKMPWASCWVEKETKTVVNESGYNYFPAAVPRYKKTPDSVYGRGRGELAFPDIWTLNSAKRMGLEDWALKIRPPVLHRSNSVMGTLKLVPGGPTSINTHGQRIQDTIMPFQTGSSPEVSHLKEEELRQTIREIFFVDTIRQLLMVEKSQMTAFEFAKKIELLFKLVGTVYGRLQWEFLHAMVSIMFEIQMEAGAFPPPPPSIYETDGVVDIVFRNPLAKSQTAGDAEALLFALNDLAPLVQAGHSEALDRLNVDRTADGIFDLRGVPAKWQNNDDEIASIRQARAKEDQADNMAARIEQVGKGAGAAAPMLELMQRNKQGTAA